MDNALVKDDSVEKWRMENGMENKENMRKFEIHQTRTRGTNCESSFTIPLATILKL